MYLCELIQGLIAIFFPFNVFVSNEHVRKLIYPCFKLRIQFFEYYSIRETLLTCNR